jgi:hypothetical protein
MAEVRDSGPPPLKGRLRRRRHARVGVRMVQVQPIARRVEKIGGMRARRPPVTHRYGISASEGSLGSLTRFRCERDAVENCYADPELESLRAQPLDSTGSFGEVGRRSAPNRPGRPAIEESTDTGADPEQRARYHQHRAVSSRWADEVVAARDALLEGAPQAALLDRSSGSDSTSDPPSPFARAAHRARPLKVRVRAGFGIL